MLLKNHFRSSKRVPNLYSDIIDFIAPSPLSALKAGFFVQQRQNFAEFLCCFTVKTR